MGNGGKHYASGARMFSSTLDCTAVCKNGAAPACAAACPYGLDVRGLIRKLQRGSFRGAYNVLAEQLLFPQAMCAVCGASCMAACAQENGDACIRLPLLEQAVFAQAGEQRVRAFRVPPKAEKIAVIGAGLGGLCCAYALASLGYPVTVYDRRPQLGGRLHELLPAEGFLPELERSLALPNIELCLAQEVSALRMPEGFRCVLIATGAGAVPFDCADRDDIFFAGEVTGVPLPDAVKSGRQAASEIDAWLKTGVRSVQTPRETAPQPVDIPAAAETFSKDEAQAEAARCRLCDCKYCYDACEVLQYYKTMPPKVEADVRVTLNPVDGFMARRATRLISSCSDCGRCLEVCPEQIDLNALLMESRTMMTAEDSIPPAYHDFWLRDMAFSCGEDAVCLIPPENGYLFFPGCQLGASDPENVRGAHVLLQKALPGTGLLLNCCGVPAKWAGERELFQSHLAELKRIWEAQGRPRLITACPTCRKTLAEGLPEAETVSLYALLAQRMTEFPAGESGGTALFHPCAARSDPAAQEGVAELLRSCGMEPVELPEEERNACCGFGGHIYPANPELFDAVAEKRTAASALPYVTYCANCRDIFTAKGKNCRHILDILTGREVRPLPTLQQRRDNRRALKAYYSRQTQKEEHRMELLISDELRRAMDRALILDEDIAEVIRCCTEERRFLLTEDGACIGHLRQGTLTYWVRWRSEGDAVCVLNAYSHRMTIEGE